MFKNNNIGIYFFKIDDLDPKDFEILIPEKLQNAHPKRIKEFIAGRYCIFKAAKHLDIELKNLPMNDKGAPIWPKELVGSISHSKGFAIGVVALKKGFKTIGIDTEEIINDKKFSVIEKNILTEPDNHFVIKQEEHSKNELYTLIFSAKEALYKLINPLAQTYFGFQEAYITEINLETKTFKICLNSKQDKLIKYNGVYEGEYRIYETRIVTLLTLS